MTKQPLPNYAENPYATASGISSFNTRSVDKIFYAVADYDNEWFGDGYVDGKILFVLHTTQNDDGSYRINTYTAEIPMGESLTLTIDGEEHELEIEVSDETAVVSGSITVKGGNVTASAITASEPADSSIKVSIDGQNVSVSDTPEAPVASSDYDELLMNMISIMFSSQFVNSGIDFPSFAESDAEIGQVYEATLTDSQNNEYGTYKYTYINDDAGMTAGVLTEVIINTDGTAVIEASTVTWKESIEYEFNVAENSGSITYHNFQVTKISGPAAEAIPEGFELALIDGETSGALLEGDMTTGSMDLSFNGKKLTYEDSITMTLLMMIPAGLSSAEYEGSGSLADILDNEDMPVNGTYSTNSNNEISVEGNFSGMGISADFTLTFAGTINEGSYNRKILSYTFNQESVNPECINFLMGVLN